MEIHKQDVIVIGGIHGSGKSTLIQNFQKNKQIDSFKQRHLLNLVGEKYNLKWPETGINHHKLIDEAIEAFISINSEKNSLSKYIFIDCHYAIRKDKAVRLIKNSFQSKYIPDIDPKFIKKISSIFNVSLVLCKTDPHIARERIFNRNSNTEEYDYTIK